VSSRRSVSLSVLACPIYLCLTGCSSTPKTADEPPDPHWATAMRTARAEFARGRPEQAATTYRRALSRARAIDDPTCISDAAYNLAACLTCLDEHEQARPFLREA